MKGGRIMVNVLVDYLNPEGVECHTSFQADAGSEYYRKGAESICRGLKTKGSTPQKVTFIPGDFPFAELELIGLPQSHLPILLTCEVLNINHPHSS